MIKTIYIDGPPMMGGSEVYYCLSKIMAKYGWMGVSLLNDIEEENYMECLKRLAIVPKEEVVIKGSPFFVLARLAKEDKDIRMLAESLLDKDALYIVVDTKDCKTSFSKTCETYGYMLPSQYMKTHMGYRRTANEFCELNIMVVSTGSSSVIKIVKGIYDHIKIRIKDGGINSAVSDML